MLRRLRRRPGGDHRQDLTQACARSVLAHGTARCDPEVPRSRYGFHSHHVGQGGEVVGQPSCERASFRPRSTSSRCRSLLSEPGRTPATVVKAMREEVVSQMASLGFATKKDLARLERKIDAMKSSSGAKKAPQEGGQEARLRRSATAKKAPAKKAAAKQGGGAPASRRWQLVRRLRHEPCMPRDRAHRRGPGHGGALADKASRMVGAGDPVEVLGRRRVREPRRREAIEATLERSGSTSMVAAACSTRACDGWLHGLPRRARCCRRGRGGCGARADPRAASPALGVTSMTV